MGIAQCIKAAKCKAYICLTIIQKQNDKKNIGRKRKSDTHRHTE